MVYGYYVLLKTTLPQVLAKDHLEYFGTAYDVKNNVFLKSWNFTYACTTIIICS